MAVVGIKYLMEAQDMDRCLAFWRDTFGFQKLSGNEHFSEVQATGGVLAFHGGHDGSRHPTGLSIEVDDIHGAVAAAVANGATVTMAPVERAGEGIFLADLVDREGNTFMLSQAVTS